MSDCCDIFRFTDPGDGFSVGEGKVHIDVDSQLSGTSENPVQNKVIYNALQNFHIDVDDELSATSENPVQNKVITQELADQKSAIDEKQDAPSDAGLAGQVLGLDDDLNPVWLDQTGGGGSGGTTNYNNLTNKPRINGVLLSGDKSAADLGLATASDIPTVPVQSVNGKTGAVELDASDVGALPDSTAIPSKTSDLTNDSGFVNASGAAAAAPVQSVNGDTGDVTISVPSAASSGTPAMDGTASIGSSSEYARADHVHPTDTSRASAAELATYARPNLLDNWYFVGGGSQLGYGRFPINQRGQTTYSGSGYCVDRWGSLSGDSHTVELLASGMKVTKGSTGSWPLWQLVTSPTSIVGKTVTFSVLYKDATNAFTLVLNSYDGSTYASANSDPAVSGGIGLLSVTTTLREADTAVRTVLRLTSGSATIIAAKLEVGSTQTLAHQENGAWVLNEIPNYSDELYKCCTSRADANDTYSNKTVQYVEDTGWIDLSSYVNTSIFSIRSGFEPGVRIINGVMFYKGELYITTQPEQTAGQPIIMITGIPTKYGPRNQISAAGLTYRDLNKYLIFADSPTTIKVIPQSYSPTAQYCGFSLGMLSGNLQ